MPKVPADVLIEDPILGPLTARQVVILAAPAAALYLVWHVLPPILWVPLAVLSTVAALALALIRRDGVSLDRWLWAWARYQTTTRPVPRIEGGDRGRPARRDTGRDTPPEGAAVAWAGFPGIRRPAPALAAPVRVIRHTGPTGAAGVLDLGPDGAAVIAAVSPVNLSTRTPEEQAAAIGKFAACLDALTEPVQVLVRTVPVSLDAHAAQVLAATQGARPELAAMARAHAAHLRGISRVTDLVHRQCFVILRDPHHLTITPPLPTTEPADQGSASSGSAPHSLVGGSAEKRTRRRRTGRQVPSAPERVVDRAVAARLGRRLAEVSDLLAVAGLRVTPLNPEQAAHILSSTPDTAPGTPQGETPAGVPVGVAPRYLVGGHTAAAHSAGGVRPIVTNGAVAVLAVTTWPAELPDVWLDPLLSLPGRVDISMHIHPVDPATAAARLRRRQTRLEGSRAHDAHHGRVSDPRIDAAAQDAGDLARQVATGRSRVFRVSVLVAVHASARAGGASLAADVAAIKTAAASMLLRLDPLTWRQVDGWRSCLPVGLDRAGVPRMLDSGSLSAAFPFHSADAPADHTGNPVPSGAWWGLNLASAGVLTVDRYDPGHHNHNAVILGSSGSGKSATTKIQILRDLYRGVGADVVDLVDEYAALADAVGGRVLRLGTPGNALNPFALHLRHTDRGIVAGTGALRHQRLTVASVVELVTGVQDANGRAVLDDAIGQTYRRAGITDEAASWIRTPPVLADLVAVLSELDTGGRAGKLATEMARRLAPFIDGARAGLFALDAEEDPADTDATGGPPMVVWSLRAVPDQLRPAATVAALDRIWRTVTDPGERRRRSIVIDEAWRLLQHPDAADFLFRMAKTSRKLWAGLVLVTQDTRDVLATDLGRSIVSNSAVHILQRQPIQAADEVRKTFGLTDGEIQFLIGACQGEALVSAAGHRAAVQICVGAAEDPLIRTDPQFFAEQQIPDEPGLVTIAPVPTHIRRANVAAEPATEPFPARASISSARQRSDAQVRALPPGWS